MLQELASVLTEGKALFPVTGASIKRMRMRFIEAIPSHLRQRMVAAHCSGAEVWGFDKNGNVLDKPFYSVYDTAMTDTQKRLWRQQVQQLLEEFKLKVFEPAPALDFKKLAGDDPLSIIMEDRGPQITLELINGYDLRADQVKMLEKEVPETHGSFDLRIPIIERAEELFTKAGLPVTPRLAGVWAVDFAIKGVNKTTAVKRVLDDEAILSSLGLTKEDVQNPTHLEIWGDKFSTIRGGTDRHMCEALPKEVRAIDFRQENPLEFPEGYNIVLWDGKQHEHHGLLEYLQTRHHFRNP